MSPHPMLLTALAASAVLGTMPARAADPLADYLWKQRVLLVSAAAADDPRLAAQRKIFATIRDGAKERDLTLVEAVGGGTRAVALRNKFGIVVDAFRVLLVGKDGGEKLRSDTPLGPDQLFPLIDAMPMRRNEMRRKP